jgi:hypothetical protein
MKRKRRAPGTFPAVFYSFCFSSRGRALCLSRAPKPPRRRDGRRVSETGPARRSRSGGAREEAGGGKRTALFAAHRRRRRRSRRRGPTTRAGAERGAQELSRADLQGLWTHPARNLRARRDAAAWRTRSGSEDASPPGGDNGAAFRAERGRDRPAALAKRTQRAERSEGGRTRSAAHRV